ncbi:MAG: hypothetical protein HXY49_07690 [Ignavibacteriaceae bacterium]|nr:hypothetical protein [Ignavibacteriaceae bacterium]
MKRFKPFCIIYVIILILFFFSNFLNNRIYIDQAHSGSEDLNFILKEELKSVSKNHTRFITFLSVQTYETPKNLNQIIFVFNLNDTNEYQSALISDKTKDDSVLFSEKNLALIPRSPPGFII